MLVVADGLGDEEIDGIKILDSGKATSRWKRILFSSKKAVELALEQKADFYHFHDPEILLWAHKLKKSGAKVVYDVHEDLPRQLLSKPYLNKFSLKIIAFWVELFENKVAGKCDMIVTVTPSIVERFQKFHPNVIRLANFPMLKEFGKIQNEKQDYVCYVGGLTITRGIYEMLEVAKLLNCKLKLAGIPDSSEILQKVKSTPNVEYLGILNRDEVTALISGAKVGLCILHPIPNYLEAYPIKIFEYMAAGTPVVASNFPLYKEIVENTFSGINVNPLNIQEVVAAIHKILESKEMAAQMGSNGIKMVNAQYNWEAESHNLTEAYQKIIK